ncbi:MAG TPA: L-threonylcarbamoyladenylate synthase [Sphingorhabdus sp.]|jgi:L-threonylcarbamoyladenylate synthase|uniref:L-threonylcarbamoyladenylate synthase n=1 Tax=Sphingorhabdus sp. TaxID=1902408 RepID=UPI0026B059A3|nr:L-threonylcarbamoyladenylate synthase [Sphingorhabdus sp.]HQS12348.1 L-threonylcarbamoyladenylate synthase [Sphingorhabdus sp.]HQS79451.1 L-threonylcarbamoyladenylate synthase [Sphingorhabdus sp.]
MMFGSNTLGNGWVLPADDAAITAAMELLRSGQIVAIPTETVYGLAADASNADAVAKIYAAKGRPDFNPLIVHVADQSAAENLAEFSPMAHQLAQAFWPGPLTLVLPLRADADITGAVTAGLPTIALRCPAHPVMQAMLKKTGLNIAAPSANKSGGISPTRAEHVLAGLGGAVPMILDGGPCSAGLESTIVAVREHGWQILRPGPVTAANIEQVLGIGPLTASGDNIEAPGQLASHYAPSKAVRLNAIQPEPGEWHIGFGAMEGNDNLSASGDLAQAAANLFDALHRADASAALSISVAPIPHEGIGVAINDRLQRASIR